MSQDLVQIITTTESLMNKSLDHLQKELVKIRAGKATPEILDGLMADYYGTPTPLQQVANIAAIDARTLTIQPWEKKMLPVIEKAILASNIGLTPQSDGLILRIFLPPLTEERRKELVKKTHTEGEGAKISLRNIRREAIEEVKTSQKNGVSEDLCKNTEKELQTCTDKFIALVAKALVGKEKEIMPI